MNSIRKTKLLGMLGRVRLCRMKRQRDLLKVRTLSMGNCPLGLKEDRRLKNYMNEFGKKEILILPIQACQVLMTRSIFINFTSQTQSFFKGLSFRSHYG